MPFLMQQNLKQPHRKQTLICYVFHQSQHKDLFCVNSGPFLGTWPFLSVTFREADSLSMPSGTRKYIGLADY